MVKSFQYLARVILPEEDDWTAVTRNLYQARAVCKRTTRIHRMEGAEPRVYGLF